MMVETTCVFMWIDDLLSVRGIASQYRHSGQGLHRQGDPLLIEDYFVAGHQPIMTCRD